MLYPTHHHHHHHHPFIFTTTFNPFSQPSLSPPPPSSPLLSSTVQGMECLQGAFKNGFGPSEVALSDDFSAVAHNGGANAAVNGDDLFVDELLDFSNDVVFEMEGQLLEPQELSKACSVSVEKQSMALDCSAGLTPIDHFGSIPGSGSTDPVEEGLESLEWLSHFVEDSFSEYAAAGKLHPNPVQSRSEKVAASPERPCFPAAVQTKARTKRARSGVRVWPVLSSSTTTLADSSSISSSSSSNSSTTSFPFRAEPRPSKMQKKRPADAASQQQQNQQPRKCSHCGVTKTPQWRAGPHGPKTLCNACGVRFKSGRLLPEYRPACSPTFSSDLHSNNHRKVLEMRKKKEFENGPAGLSEPVAPNF